MGRMLVQESTLHNYRICLKDVGLNMFLVVN